ncbi:TolC family protein [Candidatus Sumerlaeota bacterium]|nr:TolC family protein [Candidatus Sumerlaeota bacterium]
MSRSLSSCAAFALTIIAAGCARPPTPQWKALDASAFADPLSLEKSLELAHSNDLRQAEWKARMAAARAGIAKAKEIPNPTLNLLWEDIGLKDAEGTNLAAATYGVSWPALFWWGRGKRVAAARAEEESELASIAKDRRELDIQIGEDFFKLLAAQKKFEVQEDLLHLTSDSLHLARVQHDLKMTSDYEYDQARAEQLQAESALEGIRAELRAGQLEFAFALGADRPVFARAAADENDGKNGNHAAEAGEETNRSQITDGQEADTPPQALIEIVLKNDPGWREASAGRRAAEAHLAAEQRAAIPLAETSASAGRKNDPDGMASLFSFDIPVPLFNWNRAGIREAKAKLLEAQAAEEKVRRTAIAQLSLVWNEYQSARRRWENYSKPYAEIAARNERSAAKLFAAGELEYTELLRVRRDSGAARMEEIENWTVFAISKWKLNCYETSPPSK